MRVREIRDRHRFRCLIARSMLSLSTLALCTCHSAPPAIYAVGDTMLPSFAVGENIAVGATDATWRRGDIAVFAWAGDRDRMYVKRIIGVAGDAVAVKGTEVSINGTPIARCHVGHWSFQLADQSAHEGELWLEAFGANRWLVVHDPAGIHAPPGGPWTVSPGEVFVIGDNRENSFDTRVWFEQTKRALPIEWIVGVARSEAPPHLPAGAEALRGKLEECVARLSG